MQINQIKFLKKIIEDCGSVVVAFSGGVDSAFLAKVCSDTLDDKAVAVTVSSIFISDTETREAKKLAGLIGIRHIIVRLDDFDDTILGNTKERCYFCKKEVFSIILDVAGKQEIKHVFDGSNLDDLDDFRPGIRALRELGIRSPFIESRITKKDIRILSRELGLPVWNKPSSACLASRIPYNQKITRKSLRMIDQAEGYLKERGFRHYRVRCHHDLARIEVSPEEREKFFNREVMDEVAEKLLNIGFKFVSLDLEGYRRGKLN